MRLPAGSIIRINLSWRFLTFLFKNKCNRLFVKEKIGEWKRYRGERRKRRAKARHERPRRALKINFGLQETQAYVDLENLVGDFDIVQICQLFFHDVSQTDIIS